MSLRFKTNLRIHNKIVKIYLILKIENFFIFKKNNNKDSISVEKPSETDLIEKNTIFCINCRSEGSTGDTYCSFCGDNFRNTVNYSEQSISEDLAIKILLIIAVLLILIFIYWLFYPQMHRHNFGF
ncbi:MAG: hypothetical protein A2252_06620 [Elusimicrobia bacterium RIFOXYA2_FULL_39_19]|nr:MAG: hypothetical protein A2252_06620 [Elusimicrobia bacterium RIFOXYA2_FULL_39_19]